MKRAVILSTIILLTITSCGTPTISWKPPFLPIAVVFSKDGAKVEFDLGIEIPYLGTVNLEVPLMETQTAVQSLYVNIDGAAHQYDISSQNDKKFESVICRTGCEISIEIAPNGSIILNVQSYSASKPELLLLPNPGNYSQNLIVTVDAANIRNGPGVEYNEIGGTYKDRILKSDGTQQIASNGVIWYRVIVPEGNDGTGQEGWISSKCVALIQ